MMAQDSKQISTKSAPKKAPKKAAGSNEHKAEKDLRRTFEHHGRVKVLVGMLREKDARIESLVGLADSAIQARKYKEGADLLRAAEHLGFAALVREDNQVVSPELKKELESEIDGLKERAKEHAAKSASQGNVKTIAAEVAKSVEDARRHGAHHAAIELARAAEALAHVGDLANVALPAPAKQKQLAS